MKTDPKGTLYEYDPLGMLVTAPGSELDRRMIYTADDERLAVITHGGQEDQTVRLRVRNFSGQVLREYESTVTGTEWKRDYIYAEGRLVAGERQVAGTQSGVRHYSLDHLGSVRLITRGGDAVRIADPKYAPFGRELENSAEEGAKYGYYPLDPLKFTGHERDYSDALNEGGEDALDYMHARYYSPGMGRFLSVDPTWESADLGRPQSWNRYSYVRNNPVNANDPTGKILELVGTASLRQDVERIANTTLHNVDLKIARNGNATLVPNNVQGPPSPEQAAMAGALSDAISSSSTTTISLTANSSSVLMDSYASNTIDVADVSAVDQGRGLTAAGVLGHAITEQYQKQAFGRGYPAAHAQGIRSENAINGSIRGRESGSIDANGNGTIAIPYTTGRSTTNVVITLRNLNVICVDRP